MLTVCCHELFSIGVSRLGAAVSYVIIGVSALESRAARHSLAARPINNRWLAWDLGERTGILCCKINDFLQAFHMDRCRRVCSFIHFTETFLQWMVVEIFMSLWRLTLRWLLRSPSPNPHTLNATFTMPERKAPSQFWEDFLLARGSISCAISTSCMR